MTDKNMLSIVGTMSGTSMDGIDITYVHTDGEKIKRHSIGEIYSYSQNTIRLLKEFSSTVKNLKQYSLNSELSYAITIDHAKSIKKFLRRINKSPSYVGFHGQTIYHNPLNKLSIQLGNPQLLANTLNKEVVSNFRDKDLKQGGQGAPLAPIYHKSIIEEFDIELPACFINIGGISNLTYWDGKSLLGFDTGPGNNLMDNFCIKILNQTHDYDGNIASKGIPNKQIIEEFLKDPFLEIKGIKSLDKNYFNYILGSVIKKGLNSSDALATLLECTLSSIEISIKQLPFKPKYIYIVGGGAKNLTLLNKLKKKIADSYVSSIEPLGLNGEMIEAELIGFISARSILGLPYTFSTTTGVKGPCCGGTIYKPN